MEAKWNKIQEFSMFQINMTREKHQRIAKLQVYRDFSF